MKKMPVLTSDELIAKLQSIDLAELDAQQQLIKLRAGKDLNFFIIPLTVLILLAGLAIGLQFEKLLLGFVGGAALALLLGYAYHLWDIQWQKLANDQVIANINEIEGADGFIIWFKPLLGKQNYRRLFYRLSKQGQVEVFDYIRAVKRLQEKDSKALLEQLIALYPPKEPITKSSETL